MRDGIGAAAAADFVRGEEIGGCTCARRGLAERVAWAECDVRSSLLYDMEDKQDDEENEEKEEGNTVVFLLVVVDEGEGE